MSEERHYRVFVVETRTVEVDLWGATSEIEAQQTAVRIAEGAADLNGHVWRRNAVRRDGSTAVWMNRP